MTGHIIFYKKNIRSAVGWIGLTWFSPGLGAFLYFIFGINRIQRKAGKIFEEAPQRKEEFWDSPLESGREEKFQPPPEYSHLQGIERLVGNLTALPLTRGNSIEPLRGGDEAYPEMLEAIENASESVTLCTYIFDRDRVGKKFLDALEEARRRGVEVRVLVDDIGSKYSYPTTASVLNSRGVPCRTYMKSLLPWHMRYYNLRNHRKIMVVDGKIGYTGGMNIREGTMHSLSGTEPIRDIHFRLEGPVVEHLQQVFAHDWYFTSGEKLFGQPWFNASGGDGEVAARGIEDGPDENYEKMEYTFLAGIINARSSIRIMTPYFLPSLELDRALKLAGLEGIDVQVFIPQKSNLRMVQWASNSFLESLLARGVEIYTTPPPFTHSKLMVVDDYWSLVGSANWDPRSLKLNFEFNVECYDRELAGEIVSYFEDLKKRSRKLTVKILQERGFLTQLRDNTFRLFSPYL